MFCYVGADDCLQLSSMVCLPSDGEGNTFAAPATVCESFWAFRANVWALSCECTSKALRPLDPYCKVRLHKMQQASPASGTFLSQRLYGRSSLSLWSSQFHLHLFFTCASISRVPSPVSKNLGMFHTDTVETLQSAELYGPVNVFDEIKK